ncbi:hypothetical protein E3N88_23771 [Mikania micrantha]|uniref:Uncharacterized protein n=1 Tax=Mikania micrantha TaxID=192012 RepID=A0A5N6NFU4_9ASTR|nr:hypothetical protein E3N88_23771 [Mikania micrantha]
MGTRIGSLEFEIEEFSERHEPQYQIAYRWRSGRLCTAFRMGYGDNIDGRSEAVVVVMGVTDGVEDVADF